MDSLDLISSNNVKIFPINQKDKGKKKKNV